MVALQGGSKGLGCIGYGQTATRTITAAERHPNGRTGFETRRTNL